MSVKEDKRLDMRIGNRVFQTQDKTYVMGILNVTPDSFSDGGSYQSRDSILYRVEEMIAQGADVIDIGGESTRPGSAEISASVEISRVAPTIRDIKSRFDIPVSLDTYRSETAKAGLQAGADMINDVWGLRYDEAMAEVIAGHQVVCCLMHNGRKLHHESAVQAGGQIKDVMEGLQESICRAKTANICDDRILLDPGIGFGKTVEQNLALINELDKLHILGYPVLLGASRKSVVGEVLSLPVNDRLEGTLATTAMAVIKGCMFVRVHDIKENVRMIRMMEAIVHAK